MYLAYMRNLFERGKPERMNDPATPMMIENDSLRTAFPDDYEPIDLNKIYFPTIIPPPEFVEAWERIRAMYNAMHGVTERKIGNTWYTIWTDCDGRERLTDKIKRLIFSETFPCMEAIPG